MNNNYKIRIFQPVVPHYRVGLFTGVGRKYPNRVELIASKEEPPLKSCSVEGVKCDYLHSIRKIGPFFWTSGLSLKGLSRGDVLVIEGNVRRVSYMWNAILARCLGISVVWWGLHKMPNQNLFNQRIRAWLMKKIATTILFYNKTGIEWARQIGVDTTHAFAVGNAIDLDPIKRELEYWTELRLNGFRESKNIVGLDIVLGCSQLSEKVRMHEAIKAMSCRNIPSNMRLAIIGSGPLEGELKKLATELCVDDRIIWLGPMFDQHEIAPWFLSAKLYVYPGPVGLGILHALAYGLPAILNDTHNSTEAEVFENNKTGRMFKENDAESLSETIVELIGDEGRRKAMGQYGREKVFMHYTMEQMVNIFCSAIEDAHCQARIS